MSKPPVHDLMGLGNADGSFGKVLFIRNCGIVVYETLDNVGVTGKMSLSNDKRSDVKRWLAGTAGEPVWWPGWPVRRV